MLNQLCILLFCSSRETNKAKEEYDGIDMENLVTLERLKQNQRQDYLKVGTGTETPVYVSNIVNSMLQFTVG